MLSPSFAATTRRRRAETGVRRTLTVRFSVGPEDLGLIAPECIRAYVRLCSFGDPGLAGGRAPTRPIPNARPGLAATNIDPTMDPQGTVILPCANAPKGTPCRLWHTP